MIDGWGWREGSSEEHSQDWLCHLKRRRYENVDSVAGRQQGLTTSGHHLIEAADSASLAAGARESRAAITPPDLWGTAARRRPISMPLRVPASIRSLRWPRWPMRKTLPASLERPAPRDISKFSRMILRRRSASWPAGVKTAVVVPEYSSAFSQTISRPQARTAERAASAWRCWRRKTVGT